MMKIIFKAPLFLLTCLLLLALVIPSCKKDKENNPGKVELLSYGPAGVKHGEPISFIGKNLDKVNEIEFVGASVPQSAFEQQTAELIVVKVPPGAERGVVILKTPDGDITSKAPIDFDVPFTIQSITETVRPGENITIKGEYLNWITGVHFADDTLVTEFVSQTLTELVVKVPLNAQTGILTFYGAGTEPLTYDTENELNVVLPSIGSFSPALIEPQGKLTITGENLDLVMNIGLNGVVQPISEFESRSATQLVVKIPPATRAGEITLRAFSGVLVMSSKDLVVNLPAISTFAPALVDRGDNITITGINLNLATAVIFKGSDPVTKFESQSKTQIVVKVPIDANKGPLAVKAISGVEMESAQAMELKGGLPPLAPLGSVIYDDALAGTWGKWGGWGGGTTDLASTDNVRDGDKSIKVNFAGGWSGALQMGGNTSTAGFTQFVISIFGTPGTNGKKFNLVVKGGSKDTKEMTMVEGEWTEYKFSLTNDFGSPATITEIQMQDQGWAGVIYVDHVGLR